MKVLFVCRGNNCRSQIAEAVYNRLTDSTNASSAGTHVEGAGITLLEFSKRPDVTSFTMEVMHDAGFNLENKVQTQLTRDMLHKYDVVVSMAAKQLTPSWLSSTPNYVYWKIPDPKGRSYEITKRAKEAIEQKIHELVKGYLQS
jgi:protein-tyrosine-phosphatase